MRQLVSLFTRSFSTSGFSLMRSSFFSVRRFASAVAYHPPTSAFAHPIPKLPIIDLMVEKAPKLLLPTLDKVAFVGVQHILETTATLFKGLIDLGVGPENMFFAGKPYSTSPEVAAAISDLGITLVPGAHHKIVGQYQQACREGSNKMWQRFIESIKSKSIEKIVVLDDGGRVLEAMPSFLKYDYMITGIEQTRGGLYSPSLASLPFPLIEVATSAVKCMVESPLIAEAVLNRVRPIMRKICAEPGKTVFGVVGNGAIGFAITNYLLTNGFKVVVYDENGLSFNGHRERNGSRYLYRVNSSAAVIANSDCIFGCTGRDITEGIDVFGIATTDKIFISCTSEDKEFLSLLKKIANVSYSGFDPLGDILYTTECGGKISILSGGFPINFDRKPWNVPASDIEVTQGLLFGACLQAMRCATTPVGDGWTVNGHKLCLNPHIQRYVATMWGGKQPQKRYPEGFFSRFHDVDFIAAKSGGAYKADHLLEQVFGSMHKTKESTVPKLKV